VRLRQRDPKTDNRLLGQQAVKLRVQAVLERLFGCSHRNVSRPFTILAGLTRCASIVESSLRTFALTFRTLRWADPDDL
jgi:hypothetical protein